MPATRRKLNTIRRPRAAASTAKETSSDPRAIAITAITDAAPATSADAADNVSKADHAEAEDKGAGAGAAAAE